MLVALAVAGASLVTNVAFGTIDRNARRDYQELIDTQPGRQAIVTYILTSKQRQTTVRVTLDGVEYRVGVRQGEDVVVFQKEVTVHLDPADPEWLAIAGTGKWTWHGTMTRDRVALFVLALVAACWFATSGKRTRERREQADEAGFAAITGNPLTA